jgi:hypothetical protein
MKITKRHLRRIIKENISSDRIYLDVNTSYDFDLDYENDGQEWIIRPRDFSRLKRMTQYDKAHQEIFSKYDRARSTTATGVGYGWWELK